MGGWSQEERDLSRPRQSTRTRALRERGRLDPERYGSRARLGGISYGARRRSRSSPGAGGRSSYAARRRSRSPPGAGGSDLVRRAPALAVVTWSRRVGSRTPWAGGRGRHLEPGVGPRSPRAGARGRHLEPGVGSRTPRAGARGRHMEHSRWTRSAGDARRGRSISVDRFFCRHWPSAGHPTSGARLSARRGPLRRCSGGRRAREVVWAAKRARSPLFGPRKTAW